MRLIIIVWPLFCELLTTALKQDLTSVCDFCTNIPCFFCKTWHDPSRHRQWFELHPKHVTNILRGVRLVAPSARLHVFPQTSHRVINRIRTHPNFNQKFLSQQSSFCHNGKQEVFRKRFLVLWQCIWLSCTLLKQMVTGTWTSSSCFDGLLQRGLLTKTIGKLGDKNMWRRSAYKYNKATPRYYGSRQWSVLHRSVGILPFICFDSSSRRSTHCDFNASKLCMQAYPAIGCQGHLEQHAEYIWFTNCHRQILRLLFIDSSPLLSYIVAFTRAIVALFVFFVVY